MIVSVSGLIASGSTKFYEFVPQVAIQQFQGCFSLHFIPLEPDQRTQMNPDPHHWLKEDLKAFNSPFLSLPIIDTVRTNAKLHKNLPWELQELASSLLQTCFICNLIHSYCR